ncbi:hypothetical protein ACU6T4_08410 [Avibacterium paragallinarum]|uniref:Uncharacterized protein n=1 Tax=Avibacterium paragallinarum TaxID=728 RepID=A0A0F5ENV1_AVIPA|nr:hypothetical protein [Avibacterium paragallinarum]POY45800.1 hypothetical protein C3364_10860 [Avibacterium paragallinarum]QIR12135.1 hypothetical protein HBL79_07775 [Avibacterium paragallinarum]QJE09043.1 hypothetical protein HHJ62_01265 [Avibacterium paragallinarum]QJE11240.1 hypothetical protein HHJ61_01265 [Avibacterium paragallinarum]QJE13438.1 hypothetical protein HHJ60_01270 [Avibacterium paragallinarum]
MTFKIDSGWFLLALLLIATALVILTINSVGIGKAYITQANAGESNLGLIFAWSYYVIAFVFDYLTRLFGWLAILFFCASIFGYRIEISSHNSEKEMQEAHQKHAEHSTGKQMEK